MGKLSRQIRRAAAKKAGAAALTAETTRAAGIADNVASAIIAAGHTPAEATESARAVRKLFDQPGDVLSAYSREMADHAANLMEAEILRRVAAATGSGDGGRC